MFDKEYSFKGRHAQRVEKLTSNLDDRIKGGLKLFGRNLDVYMDAPLVGILYNRKAEADYTKNPVNNETYVTKIFGDILIQNKLELEFNYKLIMLLDERSEKDPKVRISKAFRRTGDDYTDIETYESYVRGGIDVLYEKLIEGVTDTHEYIERLAEFVGDFQEKYNDCIDFEEVCKLSRGED
ncbi:MAG: hypothetical protein J6M24_07485 [Lachnospiraceae bacterium]|nr:hypothetical protein [Lachnospiraceae bacterium]